MCIRDSNEYTDAIWVYWSQDLNCWHPADKAVVLDGANCSWSRRCIGLPSVVQADKRLAIFYDAPSGDSTSHMRRDVGLAWLDPVSYTHLDVYKRQVCAFPNGALVVAPHFRH